MRQLGPRRIVGTLAVVGTLVIAAAGPAAAHVEIDPGSQPKGATVTFAFRVPDEEDNAATVRLDVQFPTDHPIANVLVQVKPGWTFTTQSQQLSKPIKTDDGTFSSAVTEISWVSSRRSDPARGLRPLPGVRRPAADGREPAHVQGGADLQQRGRGPLDRAPDEGGAAPRPSRTGDAAHEGVLLPWRVTRDVGGQCRRAASVSWPGAARGGLSRRVRAQCLRGRRGWERAG